MLPSFSDILFFNSSLVVNIDFFYYYYFNFFYKYEKPPTTTISHKRQSFLFYFLFLKKETNQKMMTILDTISMGIPFVLYVRKCSLCSSIVLFFSTLTLLYQFIAPNSNSALNEVFLNK